MKCDSCNLVNFNAATSCKRCGSLLQPESKKISSIANISTFDNILVIGASYLFPNRCLKCNQPTGEKHQKTELKYYPKYNFVSLLVGVLFTEKIKLKIPLCRKHIGTRTNISGILSVLLVTGVIALLIGLYHFIVVLILFGGILIGLSVFADIKITPLTVIKVNNGETWIKGAGKKFLATLPVNEK